VPLPPFGDGLQRYTPFPAPLLSTSRITADAHYQVGVVTTCSVSHLFAFLLPNAHSFIPFLFFFLSLPGRASRRVRFDAV
jgi:hypothetical protein